MTRKPQPDRVGYWSELKLEIVEKYAKAYSTILGRQGFLRGVAYVDAFSGMGLHVSKADEATHFLGSPRRALEVVPPFDEFYFCDLDGDKLDALRAHVGERDNVTFHAGDCNAWLREDVLPLFAYDRFRRALCLLDPYAINVEWETVCAAGKLGTVEVFLNFMVMDMNMNVLRRRPDQVEPDQLERMRRFWGDESWKDAVYVPQPTLFGPEQVKLEGANDLIVGAYCDRLRSEAGFKWTAKPLPLRNDEGKTVYYLVFASPNQTGRRIVNSIFDSYRTWPPQQSSGQTQPGTP